MLENCFFLPNRLCAQLPIWDFLKDVNYSPIQIRVRRSGGKLSSYSNGDSFPAVAGFGAPHVAIMGFPWLKNLSSNQSDPPHFPYWPSGPPLLAKKDAYIHWVVVLTKMALKLPFLRPISCILFWRFIFYLVKQNSYYMGIQLQITLSFSFVLTLLFLCSVNKQYFCDVFTG